MCIPSHYRVHTKGELWDWHYHKDITEINLLVSGKMIMQGKELNTGDIFIVNPGDPANEINCHIKRGGACRSRMTWRWDRDSNPGYR